MTALKSAKLKLVYCFFVPRPLYCSFFINLSCSIFFCFFYLICLFFFLFLSFFPSYFSLGAVHLSFSPGLSPLYILPFTCFLMVSCLKYFVSFLSCLAFLYVFLSFVFLCFSFCLFSSFCSFSFFSFLFSFLFSFSFFHFFLSFLFFLSFVFLFLSLSLSLSFFLSLCFFFLSVFVLFEMMLARYSRHGPGMGPGGSLAGRSLWKKDPWSYLPNTASVLAANLWRDEVALPPAKSTYKQVCLE